MIQFITGLTAATAHVLSGPDHLAAVTPLAIESKKKSWGVGLAWGIGHTLGVLIIGLLFLLFRDVIPVDAISSHSELLVGVMLILIGVWALMRVFLKKSPKKHVHPHIHKNEKDEYVHIHKHGHDDPHEHTGESAHEHVHVKSHRQNVITALGVGVFHGLAGVSHILAILPTLALPTRFDAVMYLAGFGVGTIVAMISFSAILGYVATKTSKLKSIKTYNILRITGGLAAIAVGVWWLMMA